MTKEDMKKYYEMYNKSVDEALTTYYTDDAIFMYQTTVLNGKEAILQHFTGLQNAFKEEMTPTNILIDGDKVAVEVESHIQCKVDLPDFLGQSYKVGDSITAKFCGFYDIRDNKISHIRIYQM